MNSLTSYGSSITPLTPSTIPSPVVNGLESWRLPNSPPSDQSPSLSSKNCPTLSMTWIPILTWILEASPVKPPSPLSITPHPREPYPNLLHPLLNAFLTQITPMEWIVMGSRTSSHMRPVSTLASKIKNEVRDFMARPGVMLWTGYTFPLAPPLSHGLHKAHLMLHFFSHTSSPFPWGFTSFPYLWLLYASCSLISDSTMPCSLSILRQ